SRARASLFPDVLGLVSHYPRRQPRDTQMREDRSRDSGCETLATHAYASVLSHLCRSTLKTDPLRPPVRRKLARKHSGELVEDVREVRFDIHHGQNGIITKPPNPLCRF